MSLRSLIARRKRRLAVALCATLLLSYIPTYGFLVGRGSVDWWKPQSAFRYSDDQRINRSVGRLFYPLYWIDNRVTGIIWLDHEPLFLPQPPEGTGPLADETGAARAGSNKASTEAGTTRPTDRQLITCAVYLWYMQYVSAVQETKAPFFLVLDPDEERDLDKIYKGFRAFPVSECVNDERGVRSKATGEKGVILEAKQIRIEGTLATANVWVIPGLTGSSIYSLTLEKADGAWRTAQASLAGAS